MENAFQSKLKIRSQNSRYKERKFGESSRSENSRIKENGGDNYKNTKSKYPPCRVCKRTSHLENDCSFWGKLQCRNCGKFGHAHKDCRSRQSHQANFMEQAKRKDCLFYVCHAPSEVKHDTWYIDNGCSNHMTSNKKIFQDKDKSMKTKVKLGNGALVETEGLGTITFNTKKGMRLIQDVLLVPKLDTKIMSVS
ncbi:hypothetical protein ACP275_02G111100 [Erythranthe tilingii]